MAGRILACDLTSSSWVFTMLSLTQTLLHVVALGLNSPGSSPYEGLHRETI
jgi:hypothetical protein